MSDNGVVPAPVPGRRSSYILWDWNGTLLDDTDAAVATLNTMLSRRGLGDVTKEFFRENFAFPARRFYELVHMDVPDDRWDALAKEYHDTYHAQRYGLNSGAIEALEYVKRHARGQSVISALHQLYLDLETGGYGVKGYMDHVYGVDNLDGGSKLVRARRLMEDLAAAGIEPVDCCLIGDSLHDREVASALGVRAVLFSGGSHSRRRLESVATVGDSLLECVRLALG